MIFSSYVRLVYRGLLGGKQTAIFGVFTIIQVGPSGASPYGLKREHRHRSHRLQDGNIREYGGNVSAPGIFCDPCPTGGLLPLICWATLGAP